MQENESKSEKDDKVIRKTKKISAKKEKDKRNYLLIGIGMFLIGCHGIFNYVDNDFAFRGTRGAMRLSWQYRDKFGLAFLVFLVLAGAYFIYDYWQFKKKKNALALEKEASASFTKKQPWEF